MNVRRVRPYPAAEGVPRPRSDHSQRDWELAIHGDLTDKQSDLVARMLEVPRRSRGTIFFDSCGGSAVRRPGAGESDPSPRLQADAVVAGECSSAAIMPFAACQRRFVTMQSTLLFHPIRWQSEENVRLEEASEWARHFQQLEGGAGRAARQNVRLLAETADPMDAARPLRQRSKNWSKRDLARPIDLFAGDVWQQIARLGSASEAT